MGVIESIISVVKDWALGIKFIAPYQENPSDFVNGYATVFLINKIPQTTIGERTTLNDITLWQINRLNTQFSIYKYINYNAINSYDIANNVRMMLGTYEASKAFNNIGLDVGPQLDEIIVDTYRDNERNRYVQHAHFTTNFYIKDSVTIESNTFTNIHKKSIIIGGK